MEVLYSLNDFPPRSFCKSKYILSVMNWSLNKVSGILCQSKCFSKKQACMRRDTHIRKRKDCYRNGRWCTLLKWRKSSSWRRKWSASWVLISLVYCTQHCCFQKTNLSLNSSVSLLVWFLPHFSHSSLPHPLSTAPSPQIAGRLGHQDPGCSDWLRGLRARPTWGPAGMRVALVFRLPGFPVLRLHQALRAHHRLWALSCVDVPGTFTASGIVFSRRASKMKGYSILSQKWTVGGKS